MPERPALAWPRRKIEPGLIDMTNEEFEKAEEFILDQQAKFAVGMEQLRKAQGQSERAVAKAERVVAQTGEIVERLNRFISNRRSDNRYDQ